MTTTFAENENNDLFLDSNGNISVVSGVDAVGFLCKAAAEGLRGEAVLNVALGIPNFQLIWNGVPNLKQYEAALRTEFLNTSGVVSVKELSTTVRDNVVYYAAKIETAYGMVAIDG